jgi:hypothetical protein
MLHTVRSEFPAAAIWTEGLRRAEAPGLPLAELPHADVLVIHTTPSGPQAILEALEKVDPHLVILLGQDPPIQAFAALQRRLLELLKYVLNRQDGLTTLSALAAATAQKRETVRLGLEYYAARGEIAIRWNSDDECQATPGSAQGGPDVEECFTAFQASAAETAAYRAYFRRANPYHLLGWEPEA